MLSLDLQGPLTIHWIAFVPVGGLARRDSKTDRDAARILEGAYMRVNSS